MLIDSLTANQALNPNLKSIALDRVGGYDNKNFSEAAVANLASLREKYQGKE